MAKTKKEFVTKKVAVIFGTRPEFIKMLSVMDRIAEHPKFTLMNVAVRQHTSMLDELLNFFGKYPDYFVEVTRSADGLAADLSQVICSLTKLFKHDRPDYVLVQGDTMTTYAGAMAAFLHKIPVGHIEAGLRSYDKYSPFPEEVFRQLTDVVADTYYAPTVAARDNLLREDVPIERICVTGNTGIDALFSVLNRKVDMPVVLDGLDASTKVVTVTSHRRENLGDRLVGICKAVRRLAKRYRNVEFVFPMHLNPEVQKVVMNELAEVVNVRLVDAMCYPDFVMLMQRSHLILTDSGGVQEEAPSLGKPVLVLRTETERPEAMFAGVAKIIGVDEDTIVEETSRLMDDEELYARMSNAVNPYGDGTAAAQIVSRLVEVFAE